MKKKFITPIILLIAGLFIMTGCQKSLSDSNEEMSRAVPDALLENQCRLTRFTYPGFDNTFHYNEKGLADEWRIDYGGGIVDVFTMSYSDNNRINKAWWHFDGTLVATMDFTWVGNLITEEHWEMDGFAFDLVNTYDRRGRLVKRVASYGLEGAVQYSPIGNATLAEYSFSGEPISKSELTYNVANKNPFKAIRGLPYGFPFILLTFDNEWWETSEKITLYDAGVPTVIQDPDPAQTTFQFGFQHYLDQANYFDLASNSPFSVPFEYENCGADESPTRIAHPLKNYSVAKKSNVPAPIRIGSPDFIRKQLEKRKTR